MDTTINYYEVAKYHDACRKENERLGRRGRWIRWICRKSMVYSGLNLWYAKMGQRKAGVSIKNWVLACMVRLAALFNRDQVLARHIRCAMAINSLPVNSADAAACSEVPGKPPRTDPG